MNEIGVFTGMGNNSWKTAMALDGAFHGCLGGVARRREKNTGVDTVDFFDLSAWDGGLSLEMDEGSVKVSFLDANRKAVKLPSLAYADGSTRKGVSSLTLKDGDKLTDTISMAAIVESVKFLKIESVGRSLNSYSIGKLASVI